MSNAGFVHLHVHSAYSLLKGSIKIQKLAELAKADRQPALALTDTDNMFGALEFSDKMAGYGIQPIIGCELAVDFGDQDPGARNALAAAPSRIVLLAARERGYRSLMRLNSRAFLETPIHQSPHIKFEWLQGDAEDLIALTGGPEGPISLAIAADHADLAAARCDRLASLFGDRLYVELQRHGIEKERRAEAGLIDLAYTKGLPLVATNEPYFATTDDYEAHDALLCIAGGRLIAETDRDQLTPDHRFKSRAEMAVLFADVPEALASTVEIAERCSFRPVTRKPILPRFTVGAGASAAGAESDEAAELRRQAEEGLGNRIRVHGLSQGTSEEDYRARLAFELDVITRMNYAGYFLIVADFIKWAKAEGIPVGPGRGSGAGSLVAYALTITDLDPIQFGLLFERFLNPERVSMPDFDIDFCQDGRDQVIRYVQAALRPRSGGADHHLRDAAGARRAARRRARAADALWAGRQADKTGAAKSRCSGNAGGRDRERAEAAGVSRRGPGGGACLRHRPAPGGPDPARLHPRRRHRDIGPSAERTGAALPRSEIRHAGDPVQHEMGRARGPRQIRLPRPQDADGARSRGEAAEAARHRS